MEAFMLTVAANPVRTTAQSILRVLGQPSVDDVTLRSEIRAAALKLVAEPGLLELGVKREANHVKASYYLYYDSEMKITLDYLTKDDALTPHNHGSWEAFAVYQGRLRHTVYGQVDDDKTPGYAELKVFDDRELQRGDYALVAPPHDIHGFTGLEEGTCLLTVALGHYWPQRRYFDPANRSYVVRATKNTR
jgi:predicted metal-dependent enzyme (double-stranded beta helix superfamily)